jgi:uncharacterized protein (DUF1778 family)
MPQKPKSQVNITMSAEELEIVRRAAALEERSLASFVSRAAWYASLETILDKVPEYREEFHQEAQRQLGPEGERIVLARYQAKQQVLKKLIDELARRNQQADVVNH